MDVEPVITDKANAKRRKVVKMKIVVIGGTGLIGSKLVTKLTESGHDAVPASPNTGVNTITGEGLAQVLTGASAVVDVSNSPSFEAEAVMKFFETSTRNLLVSECPRWQVYRHIFAGRSVHKMVRSATASSLKVSAR